MLFYFLKGGIIMWPILFCSVWALALFLRKFFEYKAKFDYISDGKSVFSKDSPFNCLKNVNSEGRQKISVYFAKEIHFLEKGLETLNTLAGSATLLGLCGTVIGMIKTFMVISAQNSANPSLLASGIWEALLTTAFGLMVAIPCHIGLHYLEKNSDEIAILLREKTEEAILKNEFGN